MASGTSLSHLGKAEYFSCGSDESVRNIVTQMTEGSRQSGHSLTVFIIGASSLRRDEFHGFSFHFFRYSPPGNRLEMRGGGKTVVWWELKKKQSLFHSREKLDT